MIIKKIETNKYHDINLENIQEANKYWNEQVEIDEQEKITILEIVDANKNEIEISLSEETRLNGYILTGSKELVIGFSNKDDAFLFKLKNG